MQHGKPINDFSAFLIKISEHIQIIYRKLKQQTAIHSIQNHRPFFLEKETTQWPLNLKKHTHEKAKKTKTKNARKSVCLFKQRMDFHRASIKNNETKSVCSLLRKANKHSM